VIEQYRDELEIQIRGTTNEQRIADDREAVASDLLNILHKSVSMMHCRDRIDTDRVVCCSIPIQSIATNGPSLVCLTVTSTKLRQVLNNVLGP
jgi:hypothetical protein